MASYNEVYEIEAAILTALIPVMEGQITEDVKTAITQATVSEVYMAYDSKWEGRPSEGLPNRRWHNGGLADPNTYEAHYHPNIQELNVEVKTPWQNVGFRKTTGTGTGGNDLADIIEKNGMYNAPARPFIKQAENNIKNIKAELEKTIADHLNSTV